jgi:hypothetical protein
MTAEEYKELNELRRRKQERETADKAMMERVARLIYEVRDMIEDRKRSQMPDGGRK